ncbi:MAG: ribosome silencing factor, partial [Cyanobacteriota bacterium]
MAEVAAKPSPDPSRARLALDDSKALALLAADACDDRKAGDIVLIRVEEISSIADWFVIASGFSDVQVRAIARSVEDKLEEHTGRLP